ncbi:MAG: thioether cross-link-forming SCIFF peptide maturase [Eubacteriales bacterium]|nr:thioether cross-link-forming SCIFF peptide maturase [Eubacteriales bacterium]MDD4390975.1 thioether cross-link-forming SCIFF peptide maturase [Eubacteriales bacterium]
MIHQYKLNSYNIVIDVFSGSIHVVDDVAYDVIDMYSHTPREEIISSVMKKYANRDDISIAEIEECINDVDTLIREKKLFTDDIFKDKASGFKGGHDDIKALCLHVAHNCNLNCEYCFASQGHYKGESALMSFEVGKRALDFLVENSGKRRNIEVDFFGGEPLLNWDVVKQLVAYARSIEKEHNKNFRFTLTTNGMLIDDDVIEFSNKEFYNVVLSLDGRKEIHDARRPDYSGNGSYDTIVPKFRKLVDARNNQGYYMRGTFTHGNIDFTEDILHMANLGFTQLSIEPVVSPEGTPYALTKEDLPVLKEQYEILANEMIKREEEGCGFTFYHYMLDLSHGPCIYKRIAGCGSGTEYFAVTPSGDLYPCHQFVGDEGYKMGNVFEGVLNQEIKEKFKACNVYSRKECDDCWARLYCSGGCAANAYHSVGDIGGIYEYGCELFKKRIECAIMVKAAQA